MIILWNQIQQLNKSSVLSFSPSSKSSSLTNNTYLLFPLNPSTCFLSIKKLKRTNNRKKSFNGRNIYFEYKHFSNKFWHHFKTRWISVIAKWNKQYYKKCSYIFLRELVELCTKIMNFHANEIHHSGAIKVLLLAMWMLLSANVLFLWIIILLVFHYTPCSYERKSYFAYLLLLRVKLTDIVSSWSFVHEFLMVLLK